MLSSIINPFVILVTYPSLALGYYASWYIFYDLTANSGSNLHIFPIAHLICFLLVGACLFRMFTAIGAVLIDKGATFNGYRCNLKYGAPATGKGSDPPTSETLFNVALWLALGSLVFLKDFALYVLLGISTMMGMTGASTTKAN